MTDLQSCPNCGTYYYSDVCPTCRAKLLYPTSFPAVGKVFDLHELGHWVYEGIQPAIDGHLWQFSKQETNDTIHLPGELRGFFLVQGLVKKAKQYA